MISSNKYTNPKNAQNGQPQIMAITIEITYIIVEVSVICCMEYEVAIIMRYIENEDGKKAVVIYYLIHEDEMNIPGLNASINRV
jgi:hypothetical protein